MVKVGIIGLGIVSEFHFTGLKETSARVVAVSDIDEERGKSIAKRYGAHYFKDYRKLIECKDVEAVIIALPNYLHYECCVAAISAEKHILCEKPLTTKIEDSSDLVKRVEKSDIIFQVGYMKRFHPGFVEVKNLIPELGELEFVRFHILLSGRQSNSGQQITWHSNPQFSGGGIIVHSGSHHFDILRSYLGDVSRVWAEVRFEDGDSRDYYLNALLRMKNGVNVTFQIGRVDVDDIGPSFTHVRGGWDEGVEIIGSNGMVKLENPTWQGYNPARVIKWMKNESGPTQHYVDSNLQWIREMQAFIASVQQGKLLGPSVVDGYMVDKLIHKIYLSSKQENWMNIEEEHHESSSCNRSR